jgi:hypothetical protein
VQRGNCSFAEKAYSAQQLGAKGVIVYNSVNALYDEKNQLPKVSVPAASPSSSSPLPLLLAAVR